MVATAAMALDGGCAAQRLPPPCRRPLLLPLLPPALPLAGTLPADLLLLATVFPCGASRHLAAGRRQWLHRLTSSMWYRVARMLTSTSEAAGAKYANV